MDSRYKNLGVNTILVFVGKLGSGLITFLMLPLYTRWMSSDAFGLAELINTYSNIILSIATFCMADAIFIFPKTSDYEGKCKYYSSGLLIALIGIFVVFLFAFIIRTDVFAKLGTIHENIMQIILLSSCLFLQNFTQQFTRSIDKMKVYSFCGVVHSFSIAAVSFFLVPAFGAHGYVYSLSLASVIAALYTVIASKSYKYISIKYFSKHHAHDLLRYGIPLIPNSIMWWLVDGINKPIMESGLGLSAIGIYAVASKFPSVLNIITGAFSNAWGISASEEYGKETFNEFFNSVFRLVFFILMLASMLMSVFSSLIIEVFAAPEYIEAATILPILLLSVLLSNCSGLLGGIFMARKQSKYFFYSSIYGAVASLICTLFFVRLFGLRGAAWAVTISFLIMSISRLYFVWRDVNKMEIKYYIKSLAIYICLIYVISVTENLLYAVATTCILLLYLYMNKTEILKIYNLIRNRA